jgi:hypothetical protein
MNAVTPYAPSAVAQSPVEVMAPRISRALALDLERMTDPDPSARALRSFDPGSVTPPQREEAEWAAEGFRALLGPVTRPQLVAWLGAINAGCRNPQDQEAFKVRLSAITQDCGHLPAGCFTAETRRALYAKTPFFPAAADVLAVLEPIAGSLRAKLAALERIASADASAKPEIAHDGRRVPPSAEVVAHVSAQMRLLRQDLAARRQDELPAGSEGKPVTPLRLNPAQLAAALRQQIAEGKDGSGAAALRLRVLEERYGAVAGDGR